MGVNDPTAFKGNSKCICHYYWVKLTCQILLVVSFTCRNNCVSLVALVINQAVHTSKAKRKSAREKNIKPCISKDQLS